MAGTIATQAGNGRVPALAMAKGFKGYKPMEGKKVRKVEVVEDKTLRELKKAWVDIGRFSGLIPTYLHVTSVAESLDYSASDVELFGIILSEFQYEERFRTKAGIFLSALINKGKGDDYVIHIEHLSIPLDYVGYGNTKNIMLHGDVKDSLGIGMTAGSIIVYGNAGGGVGFNMKGGSIIVNGDAGILVGNFMEGGSIVVKGNAEDVGEWMKGGEIHIEGRIGIIDNIEHGKIFHKGKLIVDK